MKQLSIRCSEEFYGVVEWTALVAGTNISDTIRSLFMDLALQQIAFGIKVGAISLTDVDEHFRRNANAGWPGLYRAISAALMQVTIKDAAFKQRFRLWAIEPQGAEAVDALAIQVKQKLRKHNKEAVPA